MVLQGHRSPPYRWSEVQPPTTEATCPVYTLETGGRSAASAAKRYYPWTGPPTLDPPETRPVPGRLGGLWVITGILLRGTLSEQRE